MAEPMAQNVSAQSIEEEVDVFLPNVRNTRQLNTVVATCLQALRSKEHLLFLADFKRGTRLLLSQFSAER